MDITNEFVVDKEKTLIDIYKKHIVHSFMWGSDVYGTKTEHSDSDAYFVIDDEYCDFSNCCNNIYGTIIDFDGNKVDAQFISESTYLKMIEDHNIVALESIFMPDDCILRTRRGTDYYRSLFNLDKWKLRKTISAICSNAWAKAHKKMTVEKDLDIYKGKKSLFHVLRLFDFGYQIAKYGKIVDFSSCNHLWKEIYENPSEKWNDYKEKYQPFVNSMRSRMVELCPKPIDEEK